MTSLTHLKLNPSPSVTEKLMKFSFCFPALRFASRKSSVPVECTQWQTDRQTRLCHTTIFTPVRKTFNTSVDLFPPLIRPTTRVFSGCQISCQFGAFQSISAALSLFHAAAALFHAVFQASLHVFGSVFGLLCSSALGHKFARKSMMHARLHEIFFFLFLFSASAKIKTCNWADRWYDWKWIGFCQYHYIMIIPVLKWQFMVN